ncbi:MAG TPA: type II 3-dehydroquinate dehydratase [Gammaproteobacteria bacterium]|jgi:3-dehydroquinate dehydratase-2|nr:type II 3-dehydroquinate dehydratase [Gammaproteobacteria bacterium]
MNSNKILILNGPGLADLSNCNEIGHDNLTLDIVQEKCSETCKILGLEMDFRQKDDEAELLRVLIDDIDSFDAFIINPVGHSHSSSINQDMYSSAINKISGQNKPVIEVHIENIFRQGKKNHKPLQALGSSVGFVSGLGMYSYVLAINAVNKQLNNN